MTEKQARQFIDIGRAESEIYEPNLEVSEEFAAAQKLALNKDQVNSDALYELTPAIIAPGDHQKEVYESGEEAIGGFTTTTDDDLVDEIGEAAGLMYEDDEPRHTPDKVAERDRHRWELDPASSEDYDRRVNHEGETG